MDQGAGGLARPRLRPAHLGLVRRLMRIITGGIVLRHADYGDYDRMVTLLTPRYGRLDAVARGCRRMKSPIVNSTELFTSGEYTLFEKNGRYSIEQCQITDSFFELRSDYDRLVHGVYWLKLLEALIPQDVPADEVFHMTLRALAHLNYSKLDAAMLTLAFEMHLMASEGYPPHVDSCVVCGRPLDDAANFDALRGGAVCPACGPKAPGISYGARRILYRLPATPYDAVEKLEGHPDWPEAARLFRTYMKQRVSIQEKFYPPLPLS